uniref:Uncharacterized protein n=1 Tax=Spironucleus salmonicida TaxID=348837 RepID=V6LCZ3_9EUKA|eukprot:EST41551.1 Hypothetical protein SS50377_18889 [Spironucleus salmonicida]
MRLLVVYRCLIYNSLRYLLGDKLSARNGHQLGTELFGYRIGMKLVCWQTDTAQQGPEVFYIIGDDIKPARYAL